MSKHVKYEPSRTLMEFRLLPGYTTPETTIDKISLETPLVSSKHNQKKIHIKIPIVSAAMQSVSGDKMAIELAKLGGLAFIFCSQSIESQVEMVSKVKRYKAGFVKPLAISMDTTIKDLVKIREGKRYSTFPVTDKNNTFMGLINKNDYNTPIHDKLKVSERMVPKEQVEVGVNITNLKEAHELLVESHQAVLPIVDKDNKLKHLVFRKDIRDHLDNPNQIVDEKERLMTGAAINTHDYKERVPKLIEAGADVIAIDSSDGHSYYQEECLIWLKENYPEVPVIGGNIITGEGFDMLVKAGARGVKVGMGGGSICITQEQKGTGRGLATAIIEVVKERDRHLKKTGEYIPIVADGGIGTAKDIVVALALGADYVMMGRYFARMEESPTERITVNNRIMKPYWGEGANRAREWKAERYHQTVFVEGVEGFVEYAGKLKENLENTIAKIKATMSTCGVSNILELHDNAILEVVSALSIREGKVHDIYVPRESTFSDYVEDNWE